MPEPADLPELGRPDLDVPDLDQPHRIHVIGAAGSGMSAIATVLATMGHRVTGSDAAGGPAVGRLRSLGVNVRVGHDTSLVSDADAVVVSTAIPRDDPEVVAATRLGVGVWRRSEMLAAICRQRRTVGVSGSHGKTTSASMLAVILRECGRHPSMVIGGDIAGIGPGAVWDPGGDWLVVEADESDGTFLELGSEVAVVTSISSDHAEYYGGRQGLDAAFARFVSEAGRAAVVCADDAGAVTLLPAVPASLELYTYGQAPGAAVRVEEVSLGGSSAEFSLFIAGEHPRRVGPVRLSVPGLHNVLNATAAFACAVAVGVPADDAAAALMAYGGVGRRFETRGRRNGVTFVDDYAHNPEKVAATLATARNGEWSRVVAVFQPHRYSRTEALWSQFGPALRGTDVLIVTDVYAAGEAPRSGVTGVLVADAARDANPGSDVRYVSSLDEAAVILEGILRPGDLCLTIGAGDVTRLADRLIQGPRGDAPGEH